MNDLVYKKAREECVGKTTDWIKSAFDQILKDLDAHIKEHGKAPEGELQDIIKARLSALKDELNERDEK